jgi:hypothetical protein
MYGAETGEDGEMKTTREQIMRELASVRSECEQAKRLVKVLMGKTSRLYVLIEDLQPDPERKLIIARKP